MSLPGECRKTPMRAPRPHGGDISPGALCQPLGSPGSQRGQELSSLVPRARSCDPCGGLSITLPSCCPGSWAESLQNHTDSCQQERNICLPSSSVNKNKSSFKVGAEELTCHILLFMPPQQLLTFQTRGAEQQWSLCNKLTLLAIPAL